MKNKYLIVSDLDGTLLNSNSQLSTKTINAIKNLTNRGHLFCIATGRPLRGSIDIYNKLGLNTVMANNNGSSFNNPTNPNFKSINLGFSIELAKKILDHEFIKNNIQNALIEGNNIGYLLYKEKNPILAAEYGNIFHININNDVNILNGDLTKIKHDINSVLLSIKSIDLFDDMVYYIKWLCPSLVVRLWNLKEIGGIIEINSAFADKALAINYLASYYGFRMDKVITFGDGDNDMHMLAKARYGVAMKNGSISAKLSAHHVSKYTNDEDGVIWELENIIKKLDN